MRFPGACWPGRVSPAARSAQARTGRAVSGATPAPSRSPRQRDRTAPTGCELTAAIDGQNRKAGNQAFTKALKANDTGSHEAQAESQNLSGRRPSVVPVVGVEAATEAPPIVHDTLRGPSAPLDADTRTVMEQRLGTDLSHVRVHTDEQAAASARAVDAAAYTVGSSIVFGEGRYAPNQEQGRNLLAHELVHTLQQGKAGGLVSGGHLTIESPGSATEDEARAIAGASQTSGLRPHGWLRPSRLIAVQRELTGMELLTTHSDLEDRAVDQTPVERMGIEEVKDQIHKLERQAAKEMQSNRYRDERLEALYARKRGLEKATEPHKKKHQPYVNVPKPRSLSESLWAPSMSSEAINAELDSIQAYLASGNASAAEHKKLAQARLELEETKGQHQTELDEAIHERDVRAALGPSEKPGEKEAEQLLATTNRAVAEKMAERRQNFELEEVLGKIESIRADSSRPGVWVLNAGGMNVEMGEAELQSIRAQAFEQLSGIGQELVHVMVEVRNSYDDRRERAREHKIVHALSSWVSDASDPGDISVRLTRAIALRNQATDLTRRGNFSEGYKRLGTLENFVRYEAEQVDKWESDLDFGAGRWVLALTILKEGLTILATAGASRLVAKGVAEGGSLIGATARVGAATTAAGAGGAIAGDLATGETRASKIWSDARTGGGAGASIGLSGGAGLIANEAFGVGRAAGFVSKAARSVGASVTSGTAVNLTAATLAGTSKKDAVVGGVVGGTVSGLGGTAVEALAGDNAWARGAGHLFVGGAGGVASSAAIGADPVKGGLVGAASSGYSQLDLAVNRPGTPTVPAGASPTSGLEPVGPAAHPEVAPAGAGPSSAAAPAKVAPSGAGPVDEVTVPSAQSPSAPGQKITGPPAGSTKAFPSGDFMNPWRHYSAMKSTHPEQEFGLVYNRLTDEWAVVAGDARSMKPGATAQLGWNRADVVTARHSHPPGPGPDTSRANRFPSGQPGDMGVLEREAQATQGPTWHAIDVEMPWGPDRTYVFRDPSTGRWTVNYPEPFARNGRASNSFPDIASYQAWFRAQFEPATAMAGKSPGGGKPKFAAPKSSAGTPPVGGRSAPKIREEDVTTGPHGPERPLRDIIARAWQEDPETEQPRGPQGRWLSRSQAEAAITNVDSNQMVPGRAYSVPIPEGAGEVVRPYEEYPETKTSQSQRILQEPADRAVVILIEGEIHTFPIGPEHPAYNVPAPTVNPPSPPSSSP